MVNLSFEQEHKTTLDILSFVTEFLYESKNVADREKYLKTYFETVLNDPMILIKEPVLLNSIKNKIQDCIESRGEFTEYIDYQYYANKFDQF